MFHHNDSDCDVPSMEMECKIIAQFHGDGIQIYTCSYVALTPEMVFGSKSGNSFSLKGTIGLAIDHREVH